VTITNYLPLLLILGGFFLKTFKIPGQVAQSVSDDVPGYVKSLEFIWWDTTWHCYLLWKPNGAEYLVQ